MGGPLVSFALLAEVHDFRQIDRRRKPKQQQTVGGQRGVRAAKSTCATTLAWPLTEHCRPGVVAIRHLPCTALRRGHGVVALASGFCSARHGPNGVCTKGNIPMVGRKKNSRCYIATGGVGVPSVSKRASSKPLMPISLLLLLLLLICYLCLGVSGESMHVFLVVRHFRPRVS